MRSRTRYRFCADPKRTEMPREELTDLLDRQTDHMSRLVEDLLDTSRIAQNKIVLQRELMDLKEIAEESVNRCKAALTKSNSMCRSNWTLIVFLWSVTECGYFKSSRTFWQIRGVTPNPVARSRSGCRSTKVAWFWPSPTTDKGSHPEHLGNIFDMFTRGRETEETQGGLGVGLALVKMLVDKHDGTLEAHSDGAGHGRNLHAFFPVGGCPNGSNARERALKLKRNRPKPNPFG